MLVDYFNPTSGRLCVISSLYAFLASFDEATSFVVVRALISFGSTLTRCAYQIACSRVGITLDITGRGMWQSQRVKKIACRAPVHVVVRRPSLALIYPNVSTTPLHQHHVPPFAIELPDLLAFPYFSESGALVHCKARLILGQYPRLQRPDACPLRARHQLVQQRPPHASPAGLRRHV